MIVIMIMILTITIFFKIAFIFLMLKITASVFLFQGLISELIFGLFSERAGSSLFSEVVLHISG